MPRITDQTRERRRQHILMCAWRCFSGSGFHATTMDDLIAATGMASTTVYRYFRSKEEIIQASTDAALVRVRDFITAVLSQQPGPSPAQMLALVVAEVEARAAHPDFDLTRLALQTWAEALRDPALHDRAQALYREILDRITDLTGQWQADGRLGADTDPRDAAVALFTVMHGLIVMHHLVEDVPAGSLQSGLAGLGIATGRSLRA